jgi:hypothetical protein
MSCSSERAYHAPVSGRQPDGPPVDVIRRVHRENEILREEVRQLRAAIQVYSELAARLAARQQFIAREFHGTL